MVKVANELRDEHSPSYVIEQLFVEASKTGRPSVLDSVRIVVCNCTMVSCASRMLKLCLKIPSFVCLRLAERS